ncbi:MAG: hypothetical protein Q9214_001105 [Letrouitia sp. 1 TL-2023]
MTSPPLSGPELLTVTEELVPAPLPTSPSTISLDFDGLLNPPLILQDDPTECGGQLWPGGMVLAQYLLRCKLIGWHGTTIIELGAGSGLVGLALALASDSLSVHLTDLPKLVPLLQHNLSINPLRSKADIRVLNWGSPIPDFVIRYPEIILAADCCYLESSFPLLLTTMQKLMGLHTICYFCFKKRRRADMDFIRKARKVFDVRTVDDDPNKEAWAREGIHIGQSEEETTAESSLKQIRHHPYLDTLNTLQSPSRPSSDGDPSALPDDNTNDRELIFVRMGITLMLSSLYMWWTAVKDFPFGPEEVRKLLLARGCGGFFGLFGIYYSLQYLPLAEATVITFLAPIVTCWACSFLLHELFTRVEQIAGLLSLFGVVLIARPTSIFGSHGDLAVIPGKVDNVTSATTASYPTKPDESHTVTPIQRLTAVGVALVGVLGASCAYTTIRWIGKRTHPLVCINYFAAMATLIATLVLLFVPGMDFKLPQGLKQWALLASLGICGFLMQLMLTAGLTYEKSSRATNIVYTQMLFALGFDKIVFDVTPGVLSVVGSSLILGSALYIAVQGNRARDGSGDEQAQEDEEERLVTSDPRS